MMVNRSFALQEYSSSQDSTFDLSKDATSEGDFSAIIERPTDLLARLLDLFSYLAKGME